MTEPRWLLTRAVLALHSEQLAAHGGPTGVRDENMLESALARPKNIFAYVGDVSLCRLAAAYGFGIARNHPFVDGNKRTALFASILFLNLNGWDIESSKEDLYLTFLGLAEGTVSEEDLCSWFTAHAVSL